MFERIGFIHHHNSNGAFDSFCVACQQLVGTEEDENDLGISEIEHLCLAGHLNGRPVSEEPN